MTNDEIARRLVEIERRQAEIERRIEQRKNDQDRTRQRLVAATSTPTKVIANG